MARIASMDSTVIAFIPKLLYRLVFFKESFLNKVHILIIVYFSDIIQSEAISTNFCRGGAYELMNTNTPDPNGYCPKDIISRLHRYIDSGIYGIDYTILPRDKNEDFFERYLITEEDRINILKNLEIENYRGWDFSDNPSFPNDIVYFFFYPASLIPRGIENAPSEKCELYIKLTWPEEQNNFLLIISFHD